jgi:hypothetical protein
MASRAVGALLALAAAVLLAVSLVTSAWWSGHPQVDGRTIDAKDAYIGVHAAIGCNSGGAGDCIAIEVGDTFRYVGYGELAIGGLATLLALALATRLWRGGSRKKGVPGLSLVAVLLAAGVGAALLVLGPDIQSSQKVSVPIGWGFFVFWGGIASGALASVIALAARLEPLRLRTSMAAVQPPPGTFDVREILREQHDSLRPAALGPEPKLGANDAPQLGIAPAPLFNAAPQLRPLYDAQGGGIVPAPPKPVLPTRAPTPLPRSAIGALSGIPTPAPVGGGGPKTIGSLPPPPAAAASRSDSEPIDPPAPAARPPVRKSVPPPMIQPPKTLPPPSRVKPPSMAPPQPRAERSSKSTISHAIPPPPTPETQPPPPVLPARSSVRQSTEQDDRLETAMRETEAITAVEIDREGKAAAAAGVSDTPATGTPEVVEVSDTSQMSSQIGDRTDVGVEVHVSTTLATPTSAIIEAQADPDAPPARPSAQIPVSTAPASLPPPKDAPAVSAGPTPACPQCESPMRWVEEHLRFYCKQCRMYF